MDDAHRTGADQEASLGAMEAACDTVQSLADARRLSDDELRAWRSFLVAHAAVTRRLEVELAAVSGLPLAHYDVLVQLAAADGGQLRMHELADRVLLSRSGVSRLVDRLEGEGYVCRASCPSDARGAFALVTDAGLARLRDATPTHLDGVRRHFVDVLGQQDLATLTRLLERVAAAGTAPSPGPEHTGARTRSTRVESVPAGRVPDVEPEGAGASIPATRS